MSAKRFSAMWGWRSASPDRRAEWFRNFATEEILRNRRYLAEHGLFHGEIALHSFEIDAINTFTDICILAGRDDDESVRAAEGLTIAVSNGARGSIPAGLLMHHACGQRVRATLLKHAWTSGKSGSVLALNCDRLAHVVEYFREVDYAHLMDHDELSVLASLPDTLTIYRGAKIKDNSIRKTAYALSWTRDYATARRFGLHGHGFTQGVVLSAEISKSEILALWETSGAEPEVVVNPTRLRKVRVAETIDPEEEKAAWQVA